MNFPYNLSQAHFTAIMVITLAVTHILEIRHAVREGVSSPTCRNIYKVLSSNRTNETIGSDQEEGEMGCTESDIYLFTIKYQTAYLRIALTIVVTTLCWGYEPLLKSWNMACAVCPYLTTFCGLLVFRDELVGPEKFGCFALTVMLLFVNWKGGQPMNTPLNVMEGLYNMALFLISTTMTYVMTSHLQQGIDGYTTLNNTEEGVDRILGLADGRNAIWSMMILVDYGMLCVIAFFGLFFFDEPRKRILLAFLSIISFIYAFKHLPSQREYWIGAPDRQAIAMIVIALMLLGTVFPSFNGIRMKT